MRFEFCERGESAQLFTISMRTIQQVGRNGVLNARNIAPIFFPNCVFVQMTVIKIQQ